MGGQLIQLSKSSSFYWILMKLGHDAKRLNISPKIDNQLGTPELQPFLPHLALQVNHHVIYFVDLIVNSSRTQWVGKACSKNVVVMDERILCQFGTLVYGLTLFKDHCQIQGHSSNNGKLLFFIKFNDLT